MKSPLVLRLAMFALVVFGGAETASADIPYSFTTIDVPGGASTAAHGINNSGQIVGSFNQVSNVIQSHGFLDTAGSFTTIDVPGVNFTEAFGINDSGQIVGRFEATDGDHGFLATPVPEPPGLLTLATSLVTLSAAVWRRKRAPASAIIHQ
jgi:hypothetical protein